MIRYFEKYGNEINIGSKIGGGGEGNVYELKIDPSKAVKIYNASIPRSKQEKIELMANCCDTGLSSTAAWPISAIHLGRGGPICGFTMPRIINYFPIHFLYSPAHRKQKFPDKDWSFLISTARNTALAFSTIHNHGHIIGDVNQGNIYVSPTALVKLIDCDSFQIFQNNKYYLCDVGVPHFTPPELQSIKSFSDIKRTVNHDNFGLAIICFHLLFMGRHPFAGIYNKPGEMQIERAIQSFRFAFSKNAYAKSMSPPPKCVTMQILPESLAILFENAFCENGVTRRPSALDWANAFSELLKHLSACSVDPSHKYYNQLKECPWCRMETDHNVFYFIYSYTASLGPSQIDVSRIYKEIESMTPLAALPKLESKLKVKPTVLPNRILNSYRICAVQRTLAIVLVIICFASSSPALITIALVICGLVFSSKPNDKRELSTRRQKYEEAKITWEKLCKQWNAEENKKVYNNKIAELKRLKAEYELLIRQYEDKKHEIKNNAQKQQLMNFLNMHFIDSAQIPNIGNGRKATLASFGIETAADIEYYKVINIKGFGDSLTEDLIRWRISIEHKFVYDYRKDHSSPELKQLNRQYSNMAKKTREMMESGIAMQDRLYQNILKNRTLLQTVATFITHSYSQTKSDYNYMRKTRLMHLVF